MKTGYSFGSLVSFVEVLDATTVKITDDQTIAGLKTFSSNPITSASQGSGGGYLTRKDYVDNALALKAPLASPTLTGIPTAPTAATGTDTTQLATTAFVQNALATLVPVEASSANPLMNGTATAGTSNKYSRGDHVHPTDTSRAPLYSPAFSGTPTAPTAAAGTNTTQIATTAFVTSANTAQLASAAPLMDGTATVGTSTLLARQDHIHPTDTSRAPLASPALTGTPTAPTAAAGTNTTQLATTAFVTSTIVAIRSDAAPLMNGTAAIGTSTQFTREDHVHPTDTSRAPLNSPALTGIPTAPTAAAGTNTTQIATTAFVKSVATPLMPVGAVIYSAASTAPVGFLVCNGSAVSRTTYSSLFAAIGTTYGAGNGSTTFNLPDLRGEFIRGWDNGRGVDSGRGFGTGQLDAFQGHKHLPSSPVGYGGGWGDQNANIGNKITETPGTVDGGYGTPRISTETRPRNVALLPCIKY